ASRIACDTGLDTQAPGGHARAARFGRAYLLLEDVKGIERRRLGARLEERRQRVNGCEPLEVDLGRLDLVSVAFDAGPVGRVIAAGRGEVGEEGVLEVRARDLARELDGASGVAQHLDGLEAGDVVEEPATAREHEKGVALHLQELKGALAVGGR